MGGEFILVWVCGILFTWGAVLNSDRSNRENGTMAIVCLLLWPFVLGVVWGDK